jgi:hypothetical protein
MVVMAEVMTVLQLDFGEADADLHVLERTLSVAIECGFADVVAPIRHDVIEMLKPALLLLAVLDGAERAAATKRYRRLVELLERAEFAENSPSGA